MTESASSPVSLKPPLAFQSKLLCISVLYLLTTLPLSIYVYYFSLSGCAFVSPASSDCRRSDLFPYPPSYGERKYALPFSRSSCTSPISFPGYKEAFDGIRGSRTGNSSSSYSSAPVLRYMKGRHSSFAGNFSAEKRKSFFWHEDDEVEVPCGFLTEFPVGESDRTAMEQCDGLVVVSAVFGNHDKIRQPKGLGGRTPGAVCFFMFVDDSTVRGLHAHNIHVGEESGSRIGVWRVVVLETSRLPYADAAMNGVVPKHLTHRLFPNAKYSIWVDAKLQLAVDPLLLVHALVMSSPDEVDIAISKHPFNLHTMEEAMATARWKKWRDVESLSIQMETYCRYGLQPWTPNKLPYTTDVPDTSLIVRRHGKASNLFGCLLFNELEAFNPRDQLAFAYVRDLMFPILRLNMFDSQVFEHVAVEFRHNLKKLGSEDGQAAAPPPARRMASWRSVIGSSCEGYLAKMWGEES